MVVVGLTLFSEAEPTCLVGEISVLLVVLGGTKVAIAVLDRHGLSLSCHGVDFGYLRFRVFRNDRFRGG